MASRNKNTDDGSSKSTGSAVEQAGISAAYYQELKDTFHLYDPDNTGMLSTYNLRLAMRTLGFDASMKDVEEIVREMPSLSVHRRTKRRSNTKSSARNKGREQVSEDMIISNAGKSSAFGAVTGSRRSSRSAAVASRTGPSKYVDPGDAKDRDSEDDDQDAYRQDEVEGDERENDDEDLYFTLQDFVTIMTPNEIQHGQDEVSRIFQLFDTQNKGVIRAEDLRRVALELGMSMTDNDLREMIEEADKDGDGGVTEEEFARIMKKSGLQLDPKAGEPISLTENARRPGFGKEGKPVQVRTNFFAIKKLQVNTIWHYDVSITPEIPADKARQLWKVIESTFPEIAKHKTVFDGRCNAYSSEEMKVDKLVRKVELPDAGSPARGGPSKVQAKGAPRDVAKGGAKGITEVAPKNKNEFTVKIARVARIELEELHRFIRREGPITPGCFTAIQALNIVMSHKLFTNMVNVGRSAFRPENAQNLGGGIEKWDGIFQSVRPGQGKLYANIDIASTAFIKGGNVAALIAEIKGFRSPDDLRSGLQARDIQSLQRHFKGCSFTVTHRGGDFKKRFKVSEISMQPADKITFDQEMNDGKPKKVSIPQYYAAAYSLKLRYPNLPCIGVKAREGKTMYFPVEVCNIVPGKRYMKKLDENQTAEMIKGTCLKPHLRAEKIQSSFPVLDFERNEYMKGFQMEVSKEMTVVPARILPAPDILYNGNMTVKPSFGSWQLNPSRKMVHGATLSSWGVLAFEIEGRFPRPVINNFIRELTTTLAENGMNVPQRTPPITYAQMGNVEKSVNSILTTIAQQCGSPPQMILVILPSKCQTYSAIKTYCETAHRTGVMTQCILSKKVRTVTKQYCGMLGLKINSKLGGVNNTLSKTAIPFLTERPTMILGADVTHPAPGENRQSVVAVVASMDAQAFKYSGRIKVQDSGVEVIDGLKFLVHDLLVAFRKQTNRFPDRILFYRDGVSEGQYAQVMATEVAAVKEACRHVNEKYNPPVTFCIVKKRHHARLFPMSNNDADRSGNCIAGTVVDSAITHPTEFDFYLQSHGGLQGTSRPTLYHVLIDENRFTADALQALTFRLCHVYARCPKSVSIVPSVYYAHLLAFRARHYQGNDFSDTSSNASGGSNNAPTFQTSADIKNAMYFV
ncbi:Protein argonaute 10 [Mortierella sp. GBA30]|nr:Protein argonaute 10 [Mortierella sp. GBA30]